MAHYSSQLLYLEDESKKSLKGISVKPLVFAFYAQFRVNAEDVEHWATVMAYDHRPNVCGDLFMCFGYTLLLMTKYVIGCEPVCGESYV